MNFMNALEKGQISHTENGAVGNITTGSKLVDLNFKIPSFRNGIDKYAFIHALNEDKLLALKWLLYLRDVREGVGERKSFREFVVALVDYDLEIAKTFIDGVDIAEYGRWDDYVDIAYRVQNDFIRNLILHKIDTQFAQDMQNMDDGKPVSLLAKWLPSANASSKETKGKAKMICRYLQFTERDYRRTLSELRAYIDVVERKMSANKWGEVNYEGVPSKANVLYKNAFSRHDEERRNEYLESLKSGNAKINANAMFLHDIVHAYTKDSFSRTYVKREDTTLEEMWKAQDKCDGFENTLVVRDGSGSMICPVGNSGVTALEVATAITLYCAENNSGEFHNKFITFGSRPKFCDITGLNSLKDKLEYSYREADCSSTDIEKTFKLILNAAIENNIPQEDMPKTVLIVSDMEFNIAQGYYGERNNSHLFKGIQRDFEGHGYKMPKLVFWNVNSRTNTIPITENENGVVLMSGFSKNLLQMAMSSETDPYKVLVAQLNKPRYEIIYKIFKNMV